VWTQERLRGYSLSAGHPVGRLDLSYDDVSGFYAAVSGSLVYSNEYQLKPLDLQESVGFTRQLGGGPAIDVGIHNSTYSEYSRYGRTVDYTEVYAGLTGKSLSGHVYLSPNYFHSKTWRLYGEVEGGVQPAKGLLLSAHAGLLVPVATANYAAAPNSKAQYDWRVGAAQDVGRVTMHLDFSGGGPSRDFYEGQAHSRTALVAGASVVF